MSGYAILFLNKIKILIICDHISYLVKIREYIIITFTFLFHEYLLKHFELLKNHLHYIKFKVAFSNLGKLYCFNVDHRNMYINFHVRHIKHCMNIFMFYFIFLKENSVLFEKLKKLTGYFSDNLGL